MEFGSGQGTSMNSNFLAGEMAGVYQPPVPTLNREEEEEFKRGHDSRLMA